LKHRKGRIQHILNLIILNTALLQQIYIECSQLLKSIQLLLACVYIYLLFSLVLFVNDGTNSSLRTIDKQLCFNAHTWEVKDKIYPHLLKYKHSLAVFEEVVGKILFKNLKHCVYT